MQRPPPRLQFMNPLRMNYQTQRNHQINPQYRREEFSQRYFNSPEIQNIVKEEKQQTEKKEDESATNAKNVSAVTKALNQEEEDEPEKKKFKRGVKKPNSVRKKKINRQLSKLLAPKSASSLLNELKPGCVYKVKENLGSIPMSFSAEVKIDNVVLGSGQGSSKSQAKNVAAENAIKLIVSDALMKQASSVENLSETEKEQENEILPWAGIASFAMHKMFSEWQSQGTYLPNLIKPPVKQKSKQPATTPSAPAKKDLPPNAAEYHPAVLLNMLYPGIIATELEREDGPKCLVKMGFTIDGKLYTGIGGNKKDARKEAAKTVLMSLYGLQYSS